MNSVFLSGRLTKDPELRYTTNNKAVLSFTLAVNREVKEKDGQKQTDYIRCQAWNGTAEYISKHCNQGDKLIIKSARIQTGSYKDKDGKTVYTTDVIVNSLDGYQKKLQQAQQEGNAEGFIPLPDDEGDSDLPW